MTLFERLLSFEIAKLNAVQLNVEVSRKPVFGWGNSDELRKVIEVKGENHYPLVWSVPAQDSDSGIAGMFERTAELNICTLETRHELLNTQRVDPDHSYQTVLLPLWKAIERQLGLSGTIEVVEDSVQWQMFPNYQVRERHETQQIWDVLKVNFTAQFNEEYIPCC